MPFQSLGATFIWRGKSKFLNCEQSNTKSHENTLGNLPIFTESPHVRLNAKIDIQLHRYDIASFHTNLSSHFG